MSRTDLELRGEGSLFSVAMLVLPFLLLILMGRFLFTQPWLGTVTLLCLAALVYKTRNAWWNAVAVVGSDGIALRGRRGKRPALIRWREVRAITLEGPDVVIHRKDAAPVALQPVRNLKGCEILLRRRWEEFQDRPAVAIPRELSGDEPEGVYRTATTTPAVLVRVAADPALDDELRARAAEMAAERGEQSALRDLADETADPAMRAFLEGLLADP
ncbi:MAG: hypothetical protein AAGE52_12385 [Myxococcota bacterium]